MARTGFATKRAFKVLLILLLAAVPSILALPEGIIPDTLKQNLPTLPKALPDKPPEENFFQALLDRLLKIIETFLSLEFWTQPFHRAFQDLPAPPEPLQKLQKSVSDVGQNLLETIGLNQPAAPA